MDTIVEPFNAAKIYDSTPSAYLALAQRVPVSRSELEVISPALLPAQQPGRRLKTVSPIVVSMLAMAFYIAIITAHLITGGDLRDFIQIGTRFVTQSHASQTIRFDPHYHYPSNRHGYDGQFYYYIALEPLKARDYVDWSSHGRDSAAYRYGRILYPLLARALALGHAYWIPLTLLLVNLLGVGLGTLAVASWLRRFGLSPWPAVLYALYPGVALGVLLDLADPLAFSFVAAGVYLLHFGGGRRLIWAGLLFALAALTRETTLLAPCVYSLWFLTRGHWRNGFTIGLLAGVPALVWRVWLALWLGSLGLPPQDAPVLPFTGLLSQWTAAGVLQAFVVVLPALLLGLLVIRAWQTRGHAPELLILALNILVLVVMLNPTSYVDLHDSARITIGVVLFALLALPSFVRRLRRPTSVTLTACASLWGLGLAVALVTAS
jgi:hypothetical protein